MSSRQSKRVKPNPSDTNSNHTQSENRKKTRTRPEWWIAKVPHFVLEHFQATSVTNGNTASISGGRQPVARLLPLEDINDSSKMRLQLLKTSLNQSTPTDLEFVVRNEYLPKSTITPPAMFVISDNNNTKQCSVEGRVALFADVRPRPFNLSSTSDCKSSQVSNEKRFRTISQSSQKSVQQTSKTAIQNADTYERMLDERTRKYTDVQQIERVGIINEAGTRVLNMNAPDASKKRIKQLPRWERVKDKRVKLPENMVKRKLFEVFDEKSYFTLKELEERTEQPRAWLKEVLAMVCVLHRGDKHIHKYSLKPDYRNSGDVTDDDDDDDEDDDDEDDDEDDTHKTDMVDA